MELLIYLLFTIALQGSIKYLLTLREESPYQQTHRWADWFVYYLRRINWFGDNIHSVAAVISWRCAKVAEWLTRLGFVVLWSQVNGRLVSGEIRIIIIVEPKCYWLEYTVVWESHGLEWGPICHGLNFFIVELFPEAFRLIKRSINLRDSLCNIS